MKPFTWLWVSRVPGQAAAIRTHAWHKGQSGESLRQKRAQIVFTLDEEEALDFYAVPVRLRDVFDRDKISRSFYERFKAQHDDFAKFIVKLTPVETPPFRMAETIPRVEDLSLIYCSAAGIKKPQRPLRFFNVLCLHFYFSKSATAARSSSSSFKVAAILPLE